MAAARPFAVVQTVDQWLRCAHQQTALDAPHARFELAPGDAAGASTSPVSTPEGRAGGLAFDRYCRLYRSLPEQGRITVHAWTPRALGSTGEPESEFELFPPETPDLGDFVDANPPTGGLDDPRGLAALDSGDLCVAEAGRNRLLFLDLERRSVRAILPLAPAEHGGPRPIDLAPHGKVLYVLTENPTRLLTVMEREVVTESELPETAVAPMRLAVRDDGTVAVLDAAFGRIWLLGKASHELKVTPHATDLEFNLDGELVVAGWPGEDFKRLTLEGPQPARPWLRARGYDGRGLVKTPDGRIGFFTERGMRIALADRPSFVTSGRVTTFRLDSGEWQTVWGRVFIDACVPPETGLSIHCSTADEVPSGPELGRTPPVNAVDVELPHEELSPPMPPVSFTPADSDFSVLHRRQNGRELPWAPRADEAFATYEAPVQAPPGRYLWVTLELTGNSRRSPRVSTLRVEYPAHDTLRRLPTVFSRTPLAASFLQRYLSPLEGLLTELDAKALQRAVLLNPDATPEEALPWLANFLGMVLDERWARAPRSGSHRPDGLDLACDPEAQSPDHFARRGTTDARRELIKNATCLFRLRGTLEGLSRFIQIYTDTPVVILERFRLRGLGGAVLGGDQPRFSSGVVGTLRVGGAIGDTTESPLEGTTEDAFRTHAHRFSVLLPAVLNEEQLDVVRHILEVHRPAHTVFELCPIGAGMRLGVGLHLGLSSFVGSGSGFRRLRVGESITGRDGLLGRPAPEVLVQSSTPGEIS